MSHPDDIDMVDRMIAAYRRLPTDDGVVVHERAYSVWEAHRSELTAIDLTALEDTGQQAIEHEGVPHEYPPDEGDNLAFMGFLAILAESLMADQA